MCGPLSSPAGIAYQHHNFVGRVAIFNATLPNPPPAQSLRFTMNPFNGNLPSLSAVGRVTILNATLQNPPPSQPLRFTMNPFNGNLLFPTQGSLYRFERVYVLECSLNSTAPSVR